MAELFVYEIPHRNFTTTVKLSEEDAEALYGDAAKKLGAAKPAEAQPVWGPDLSDDDGDEPVEEKKAPPARNKARSSTSK